MLTEKKKSVVILLDNNAEIEILRANFRKIIFSNNTLIQDFPKIRARVGISGGWYFKDQNASLSLISIEDKSLHEKLKTLAPDLIVFDPIMPKKKRKIDMTYFTLEKLMLESRYRETKFLFIGQNDGPDGVIGKLKSLFWNNRENDNWMISQVSISDDKLCPSWPLKFPTYDSIQAEMSRVGMKKISLAYYNLDKVLQRPCLLGKLRIIEKKNYLHLFKIMVVRILDLLLL